jgi:hypothetical protein
MKEYKYKFKTSTILKIYTVGLILNLVLVYPFYHYDGDSSKILLIGVPATIAIYGFSYAIFIYCAKRRGQDMSKPI